MGDTKKITVKESKTNLCIDKKIEVLDAYYNDKDTYGVTLKIKNTGKNDIEDMQTKGDSCTSEKKLGGLAAGEAKNFEIITGDKGCHNTKQEILVYIGECYRGETESSFYVDKIIAPVPDAASTSIEESLNICREKSVDIRGQCIQSLAIYKKDASICNNIQKEMVLFSPSTCIRTVATIAQDPNMCTLIANDQNNKDICYSSIALTTKDIITCEKIVNPESRKQCIEFSKR